MGAVEAGVVGEEEKEVPVEKNTTGKMKRVLAVLVLSVVR